MPKNSIISEGKTTNEAIENGLKTLKVSKNMVNVKINGKTYKVGEMKFGDFTHMEEQGFSITDAFAKNQYMLIAMGFTCVVVDCDREDAEHLIQQHVLGGGKIKDIVNVFSKAVFESTFFMKTLGIEEEKKPAENAQEISAENPNQESESK